MGQYYYWKDDDFYLNVYVQPGASKNAIVGIYNDRLKIQLTARPKEGQANQQLIKFVAKYFEVPKSQLCLFKGEHSKNKLLCIKNFNNSKLRHEKLRKLEQLSS
ncbi:MAG: hypothetical protein AMJ43_05755 [Coxiella sp. DG_40]|nr:MAG: hypothetical protein AMJ43_05755 [Coxiella sp. DG_40]